MFASSITKHSVDHGSAREQQQKHLMLPLSNNDQAVTSWNTKWSDE